MDLTVLAIPGFFGSMAYEARWLARRAETEGPSPVDYTREDTIASLAMGTGSLVVPLLARRFSNNFAAGTGRWAKPLLGIAAAGAVTAIIADAVARAHDQEPGEIPERTPDDAPSAGTEAPDESNRRWRRLAKKVAGSSAATAIVAAGYGAASTWAVQTSAKKLWSRRVVKDLGGGAVPLTIAVLGWDFLYYWSHRLQHESRVMWAIHVVHHSSEKYNLSTALRQPWADSLGIFPPYGLMCLFGVRPAHVETARQLNLIYQFWIHTDAIRSLGPLEEVFNTASHHRVHHGVNSRYIDRNHGSIFIIWDRLFGTFQRELAEDPVRYGLTKNIDTFNPLRIVSHEYGEILRDVVEADTWGDRLSYVFRGPGWAYARHPQRAGGEAGHPPVETTAVDSSAVEGRAVEGAPVALAGA